MLYIMPLKIYVQQERKTLNHHPGIHSRMQWHWKYISIISKNLTVNHNLPVCNFVISINDVVRNQVNFFNHSVAFYFKVIEGNKYLKLHQITNKFFLKLHNLC